jgi:hypothetical protein
MLKNYHILKDLIIYTVYLYLQINCYLRQLVMNIIKILYVKSSNILDYMPCNGL